MPYAQWLILGIALLLFGIAAMFRSYQEHHRTQHQEEERLLTQARVIQENLSHSLLSVNQVLLNVRSRLPERDGEKDFDSFLKTLTDAMPGVRTLLVIDANGKASNTSRAELSGLDLREREYFLTVRQNPDPDMLYVSPPFRTSLGVYSITVSRMVPDAKGQFAGVVTASLDPEYFGPLLDSVRYAPDMLASIVHWNGTRFQVRPEQNVPTELNLLKPGTFFSRHRDSAMDATVFSGTTYSTGDDRMIAQRTVRPTGLKIDQPLVVAVNRRLDGIFATWRRDAETAGYLYLLLLLTSVTAMYAYQRRHSEFATREAEAIRAVQEKERFMTTLTDYIPGMVAYWTNDLRCSFSNAAYLEWFGKSREQMRGIHIQDLMGPELFHKNEAYIRGALRGERQEFERTLTKADGSIGYTWAQYIPDKDGDKVNGFVVLVSDITKLKQAELALAESEWKLKTIIDIEPECVALLAADCTVQNMNRAGLEMLGADSEEQVIGSQIADMVSPQYREAFSKVHDRVKAGESGFLAFELVGRKGVHRWLEIRCVPMRDRQGQITESLCVIRDMTDRKRAELELERLAQTDFLTGMANRRKFMESAEKELERASRYGDAISILMMDIDYFKKINDTYGHKTGDLVLKAFADMCRHTMRSIDTVGRLGGEEFGAILPQTDEQSAMEVAKRLCDAIANTEVNPEQGPPVRFTVSIGVTCRVSGNANIDTLLNKADQALYEAKNSGRNKVCVYK